MTKITQILVLLQKAYAQEEPMPGHLCIIHIHYHSFTLLTDILQAHKLALALPSSHSFHSYMKEIIQADFSRRIYKSIQTFSQTNPLHFCL